jgi:hypothetical protein
MGREGGNDEERVGDNKRAGRGETGQDTGGETGREGVGETGGERGNEVEKSSARFMSTSCPRGITAVEVSDPSRFGGLATPYESKLAPSASKSIDSKLSNPSSGAKAQERHSSGARTGESMEIL